LGWCQRIEEGQKVVRRSGIPLNWIKRVYEGISDEGEEWRA
jgi:hypothetical protein